MVVRIFTSGVGIILIFNAILKPIRLLYIYIGMLAVHMASVAKGKSLLYEYDFFFLFCYQRFTDFLTKSS